MKLDPLFRICGSKNFEVLDATSEVLTHLLREGDRLVEPFCGSAAVSFSVCHPRLLLADAQPNLILTFQAIENIPKEFEREFNELRDFFLENPSGKLFYLIRENPPKDPVKRAAWYLFIIKVAFNTLWRVNKKGKCNSPYGKNAGISRLKGALKNGHLLDVSSYLRREGVHVQFSSFEKTIKECGENDVIYCDPPYFGQFDKYTKNPMGKNGHQELSKALKEAWKRGATVVLHGSKASAIASLYSGWTRLFEKKVVRKIRGGDKREEVAEWFLISGERQLPLFPDESIDKILCDYEELKNA